MGDDQMANDKLDLILQEISRVKDEIASLRSEFKQDMNTVRSDISLHQERIAKSEQRIEDMQKEHERLMPIINQKTTEIYEDINGAKISLLELIDRREEDHKKICDSNRTNGRQWVRNWVLTGIVTILLATTGFFIVRYIDKTDVALQTKHEHVQDSMGKN